MCVRVGARACIRPYMRAWLRPSVRLSRHVCVGRYLAPYVTLFIATRHVTRRHAIYRHTSRHKHGRSYYEAGEAVASSDIFLTMGHFGGSTFFAEA